MKKSNSSNKNFGLIRVPIRPFRFLQCDCREHLRTQHFLDQFGLTSTFYIFSFNPRILFSPGLTFIVVNKMHHMRNFATERGDQIGKSGNVPAGTIVDTNVTSKSLCDFYITSSQGIQVFNHKNFRHKKFFFEQNWIL